MLTTIHKMRGMTMVELMVAVVIFGLLLTLGIQSFSAWIQNSQTRTAAESILNGLQLARAEAVKRNAPAIFVMCDVNAGGTGSSWDVLGAAISGVATTQGYAQACMPDSASVTQWERIQQRPAQEGSRNAVVTVSGVADTVSFSSFGRVVQLSTTGTLPLPPSPHSLNQAAPGVAVPLTVVVTNPLGDKPSGLRVTVGSAGNARMCDPSPTLAANDPRSC